MKIEETSQIDRIERQDEPYPDPDADEKARRKLELELEQVGIDADMAESWAMSNWKGTWAGYETKEGNAHYFDFAPIGSDAVMKGQ